MKLNRRKTILGMGLLAGGSGATLTSAAFQSGSEASADMRVIGVGDLVVRRGSGFDSTSSEYQDSSINFGALNPGDLPLAYVDDGENGDLGMDIAVRNQTGRDTFSNILEVENQGSSTEDVGIQFGTFGADVGTGDSEVAEETVVSVYEFSSDVGKISPTTSGGEPANYQTIQPGETKQISLDAGPPGTAERDKIADATSISGDPFGGSPFDDVDLVNTIDVGTDDGT